MAYHFSFADNGVYSAADVNKITSRLVTAGIEDSFVDGVPYNLSAFNEAGTLLYTDGVVPETVNTLKVTPGTEKGTILINPGSAFFSDGSVMEVEDGGEPLHYVEGTVNYVYLKNDLINTNTSYPACTTEAPTGIYVMLAEISETGEITDKRTYAMGKLPGYASGANYVMQITDTAGINMPVGDFTEQKKYRIGNNTYHYLMVCVHSTETTGRILGIYEFETGRYLSFSYYPGSSSAVSISDLILWEHGHNDKKLRATVAVFGEDLILNLTGFKRYPSYVFPYTFYLF